MRFFSAVICAFMVMLRTITPGFAAGSDTASEQFIQTLGNQALNVVRSSTPPAQKLAYFHELLDQDFDMPAISRFVLGRYWRTASEAEREKFVHLLSGDLVHFYGQRFARYAGETFYVTGSRPSLAGTVVRSQIVRPSGAPIAVDWQLSRQSGVYKITDVVVDGVSMALSERQQLAREIQANGGQVAGLLEKMENEAAD
jgi:phospholipid transport system substrate-binding protein